MRRPFACLLLLALASPLGAHPELEAALSRLNALIAERPTDAELYLLRGDVYARHEDRVQAEANYLLAAELAPDLPRLHLARGALALASGEAAEARELLTAALARDPRDVDALILRARAQAALNAREAARADFDAALELVRTPVPELILERAALCDSPAEAIAQIDAGIARIGPAATLHLRAITLEESLGRFDSALARLDVLAAQSERKESWLKRRGDLLTRAGRTREAQDAYRAALAAIEALPQWLRESPVTARLANELRRLTSSGS